MLVNFRENTGNVISLRHDWTYTPHQWCNCRSINEVIIIFLLSIFFIPPFFFQCTFLFMNSGVVQYGVQLTRNVSRNRSLKLLNVVNGYSILVHIWKCIWSVQTSFSFPPKAILSAIAIFFSLLKRLDRLGM